MPRTRDNVALPVHSRAVVPITIPTAVSRLATEAATEVALNFLHVERDSVYSPQPTAWVQGVTPFKLTHRELEKSTSDMQTGFKDYKDFSGISDPVVGYSVHVQVGFIERWVCVTDRGWMVLVTSIPEG